LVTTGGFIVGLIGGLLDFASASMLLIGQVAGTGTMDGVTQADYTWAAILIVLGVLVVATTVLSAAVVDTRIGRVTPLLMILFGAMMAAIGTAMSGGYLVSVEMSQLYSYGMVLVGVLMVANGIIMFRGPSQMGGV
jgi:hypothetical protein